MPGELNPCDPLAAIFINLTDGEAIVAGHVNVICRIYASCNAFI